MAVIRQQRQVFNKSIGVVRANAGAERVGQVISSVADSFASRAFEKAAVKAEDVGKRAGLSQPSSRIVSLDPITNEPVGYTPPSSFGDIAARSYQKMIDQRFQDSVNSELEKKGSEFASQASSAAQYRDRMAGYVQSMYNVDKEATPYSQYILEAGGKYVSSTYTTLARKEAEAARKKVILDEQISLFKTENSVVNRIAAGDDPDEIFRDIVELRTRNEALTAIGGQTTAQYLRSIERSEGLIAMQANNELGTIYVNLTELQREKFKIGMVQPDVLKSLASETGIGNLVGLAIQAKSSESINTIVSGLETLAGYKKDYRQTLIEEAYAELSPNVNPIQTIFGVQTLARNLPPEIAGDVTQELVLSWITKNLDIAGKTSKDLDLIGNALLNEGGADFKSIEELVGGQQGKVIAQNIRSMTPSQRSDLAESITDRTARQARIDSSKMSSEEDSLGKSIRYLSAGMNLDADYAKILKSINSSKSNETKKATLTQRLESSYAHLSRQRSQDVLVTISELESIQNLLANPIPSKIAALSSNAKDVYGRLKPAYDLERAATEGFITDRISAIINQNQIASDEIKVSAIESNIAQASAEDLKWYEGEMLKDTVIVASTMMDNPVVKGTLNRGVVLPKVADAMEAALNTLDEGSLRSALGTFEQYANTTKTVLNSGDVPIDIMRESLSPSAYAQYSSILYSAKENGIEPLAVAMQLRNYDGNVDVGIKKDLGFGESSDINKVFGDINVSPGLRRDILSILRVRKAYGSTITEDVVNEVIKGYTSKMRKDSRVIAPQVGGQSLYARRQYFGTEEIIKNREQLIDAMDNSGQYNHLLSGGTAFDSGVAIMGLFSLAEVGVTGRAIIEQVGAGSELLNREQVSDNVRTRRGKRILRTELAYRPVVQAFNAGEARYEVGYRTDLETFQAIEINGQPWILEKNFATDDQHGLRHASRSALFVVNTSGASMIHKATADINYVATLEHFTEEHFLSDAVLQGNYDRILGAGKPLELFRAQRKKYEELGQ